MVGNQNNQLLFLSNIILWHLNHTKIEEMFTLNKKNNLKWSC